VSNHDYDFDFDWIIVGSGFGGSVSALRLAERGYQVCVLECGRRFGDDDFARSGWQLRDYIWAPRVGLRGILRMSLFKDVAILSGAGVGGGSLVYCATLYRAIDTFGARMASVCGEPVDLGPHYDVAERMLGVVENERRSSRDEVMWEVAGELGYGDRCHPSRVAIFRGEAGVTVPDPFFGGEGPARAGCIDCGQCMVGCRHNAKNTLDKNYLWLAERRGTQVMAERQVVDVRPLGSADGADGYAVVTRRPGAVVSRRQERVLRARGVIFSAGAVGTNRLLASCRHSGSLPRLSDQVGRQLRSNAESMCALTPRDPSADLSDGVSITASAWTHADTHMESVSFGGVLDSMSFYFVPLTGDGNRVTRPLKLLGNIARHPVDAARVTNPRGWSRRSMSFGAMLQSDGVMSFEPRRRLLGGGVRLQTRQDPQNPNPTFIPELYDAVELMAEKLDAVPQSWMTEALFNVPFTAHILGGAVIATAPDRGVIDSRHRVHGYRNMLVCDGSTVPGNPGVNPSLTIAAMTERAMTFVPERAGATALVEPLLAR
jgi:cholesterol oxidase